MYMYICQARRAHRVHLSSLAGQVSQFPPARRGCLVRQADLVRQDPKWYLSCIRASPGRTVHNRVATGSATRLPPCTMSGRATSDFFSGVCCP